VDREVAMLGVAMMLWTMLVKRKKRFKERGRTNDTRRTQHAASLRSVAPSAAIQCNSVVARLAGRAFVGGASRIGEGDGRPF